MIPRVRRFLDVRPGEGLPVLLTFLYVGAVVAAFLLARPIRNGVFIEQYNAHALVYVYAATPVALSLFVAIYTRVIARFGSRAVTFGTLLFFAANVLLFWYAFTYRDFWLLPAVFYVWVNCFGVIAPVQAWSFANSLFDTRQAKRLFGIIGAGASLGAITGGALALVLVERVGGAINMLLVLAGLILAAAAIVAVANARIRRPGLSRRGRPAKGQTFEGWRDIVASPYLRLLAALVFFTAVVTQWTNFQLSVMAEIRFDGDRDRIVKFLGMFNFVLGSIAFVVQLLVTSRVLRRFGVGATVLALPIALAFGSGLIVLLPVFWTVLLTNGFDHGLRFSVDKATYELLYLPISPARRVLSKNAIDIFVNRFADAIGAVVLGVATQGFLMLRGFDLGLRGTAAINLVFIAAWIAVAWRLRGAYVRTIHESIHRHRLDTERTSTAVLDRSAAEALRVKLGADDPADVKYALELIEAQQARSWHPALRELLLHPDADIRRRALAVLASAGDRDIAPRVRLMLRDSDLGVRTEALLYLAREAGIDPLRQIEELGDFEDFSIRAGMAAFLASPGRTQNLDAARVILEGMVNNGGAAGRRDRLEAARVIEMGPDGFIDLLATLIEDPDLEVARTAVNAARTIVRDELFEPLLRALGRPELADDAAGALSRFGNDIVPVLDARMADASLSIDVRRELPSVLLRIATPDAEQALVNGLLHADTTLRHRVISSLNKLRVLHPDIRIEPAVVELLLAAEIAGHYRSYQVMGPLRAQLRESDPVLQAMRHTMEQELERIFRLMSLLFPDAGLHDAYVGVRSTNAIVRANALEFLENVLKPELRQVLVPLLDAQVTVEERIELADRFVGAPLETTEQAVATLLSSEDPWLQSSAVYAIGVLQLQSLAPELRRFESVADPVMQDSVRAARRRLSGEVGREEMPAPPSDMPLGVGAG